MANAVTKATLRRICEAEDALGRVQRELAAGMMLLNRYGEPIAHPLVRVELTLRGIVQRGLSRLLPKPEKKRIGRPVLGGPGMTWRQLAAWRNEDDGDDAGA
jgi:hypothetical protein